MIETIITVIVGLICAMPLIYFITCAAKESKICVKYSDMGLIRCRVYGAFTALGVWGIYVFLILVVDFLISSDKAAYFANLEHPKIMAAICIADIPLTIIPYKIALKRCPQELKKGFLFDLVRIGMGVLFKLQWALCLLSIYLVFKLLDIFFGSSASSADSTPIGEKLFGTEVILPNGHVGYTCGYNQAYDTETHDYVSYYKL